jgi:broad specificity phosphatase PhoE
MYRILTLFFVRHGQGHHNAAAEKYGNYVYRDILYKDAELTTDGIKQAIDLQDFFKINPPDIVYSSSLKRCVQTMNYSLTNYNSEIFVDDRIIERLGDMCNYRSDKGLLSKLTNKNLNLDKVSNEIPWIYRTENNKEILERATSWYNDMIKVVKSDQNIKNIVIYSHYEFLEVIFKKMLDKENKDSFEGFKNCEVRKIIIKL